MVQGTLRRVVGFMKGNMPPPGSFSQLLQAVPDPTTGRPYTERLQPEAAALFSAGADTTAHTLSLAL